MTLTPKPTGAPFIGGELHGPRPQRRRLIGLLACDELGVRHLVTRTDGSEEHDPDPTSGR
jgi:hypothetical protein